MTQKELDPDFVDFNSVNRRYHFPIRLYLPFRGIFGQVDPLLTHNWLSRKAWTGTPRIRRQLPYSYVKGLATRAVDALGLAPDWDLKGHNEIILNKKRVRKNCPCGNVAVDVGIDASTSETPEDFLLLWVGDRPGKSKIANPERVGTKVTFGWHENGSCCCPSWGWKQIKEKFLGDLSIFGVYSWTHVGPTPDVLPGSPNDYYDPSGQGTPGTTLTDFPGFSEATGNGDALFQYFKSWVQCVEGPPEGPTSLVGATIYWKNVVVDSYTLFFDSVTVWSQGYVYCGAEETNPFDAEIKAARLIAGG